MCLSTVLVAAFVYIQHRGGEDATVPPRIFSKRSVWAASFFAFNTGAAYILSVYFIPIWFQAVKGASAVSSGVCTIPLLVSISLVTIAAGFLVSYFGYYVPFMIAGSTLGAVGYGIMHIIEPQTPFSMLVVLQVVAGTGVGLGLQQPLMAVQTVLSLADISTGTAIVMFLQTLGAALAVFMGQAVFQNQLVAGILELVPSMSTRAILDIGALSIRTSASISAELLPKITQVYNDALTQTFLVSATMAALSMAGALSMEWRSVKEQRNSPEANQV
jgi:MFS family permease